MSVEAFCTKAKGNLQVHWNPIIEEMKAKAKVAFESETKLRIYAQRKMDIESSLATSTAIVRSADLTAGARKGPYRI